MTAYLLQGSVSLNNNHEVAGLIAGTSTILNVGYFFNGDQLAP